MSRRHKVATYYPGGSEDMSGVGLTAELCKRQKEKERKVYMIYLDSDVPSQGASLSLPNLARASGQRGPGWKGLRARREGPSLSLALTSQGLHRGSPAGSGDGLLGPLGDRPTMWPTCINDIAHTLPQRTPTLRPPANSFMRPRCHIQREGHPKH